MTTPMTTAGRIDAMTPSEAVEYRAFAVANHANTWHDRFMRTRIDRLCREAADITHRKLATTWVSEDLEAVVAQAAATRPDDLSLADVMFIPAGFAVCETDGLLLDVMTLEADKGGYGEVMRQLNMRPVAIAWASIPFSHPEKPFAGAIWHIWVLGRVDDCPYPLVMMSQYRTFDKSGAMLEATPLDPVERVVVALCEVSAQVVDRSTKEPVDRSARRRASRMAPGLPPEVVQYHLRRHRHSDTGQHAAGDVEWSHRWIVSGHWRSQPCGPGRTLRRTTYVMPYVKGPEDKPLIGKDRLVMVDR